jgi:fructokinase
MANAESIVAAAAGGDIGAQATLVRYEERLARALAHVINLLDPDVIVLGGGLSNIDRLYENVPALWGPWVFSDRVDTRLARHAHGDSSGVRGAAWLWNN